MSLKQKAIASIKKHKVKVFIFSTLLFTIFLVSSFNYVNHYTSSDQYCMSCHVHTDSDIRWKFSDHFNNRTGVAAHCIDCHLPPKEHGLVTYTYTKAYHGFKDLYGYMAKDSSEFNWEFKSRPEIAEAFVYEGGCKKCHQNLYPATLNQQGSEAHLRYENSNGEKSCISCHITVGHYDPAAHGSNTNLVAKKSTELFAEAVFPNTFETFSEQIPGTGVSFKMVAVPGGSFKMGSPKGESFRRKNEGPVREVEVNDFWMSEIEVSWDEYLAFFAATASQGRKEHEEISEEVDGITGPTPPWGAPDQGWGKGKKPAITMSHYAATVYCQWLSQETGKTYRLPTEAEWEYAARAGKTGPYFFGGEPNDYERTSFIDDWFGPDTSIINTFVVYNENSPYQTQNPDFVQANAFGLKNMLGNVAEFCLDVYDPRIFSKYPPGIIKNPFGPRNGKEHVVRGGAFDSSPKELRAAHRDYTRTKDWLQTDPQIPKSKWWYSDCKNVGFRVVCVKDEKVLKEF